MNNQREQLLNPTESFLVQAPAGGGKTEILTQRFLSLLAHVSAPEEILAITFTRKAASEMQTRILNALERQEPHSDLLKTPNRLRILTIDALAASLCAQMPMLTEFGVAAKIIENPVPCYQEAIAHLFNDAEYHAAMETLLLHVDNNFKLLEKLFIDLLGRRDQWLPHIMRHHDDLSSLRQTLEQQLAKIVIEKMLALQNALRDSSIHPLPGTALTDLASWQTLANALLTKNGEWRKRVDPTLKNIARTHMLQQQLIDMQLCPPIEYGDQQWHIIQALITLLPVLCAQLKLVFQTQGGIDFTENMQGALRALGDQTAPSDLALRLDYQIQHLLIDEFQDTSITQFCLFEQLMRDWQPGDGRTVFLVGDPMQSIYRFRQAEVGLFWRAKTQGIANIPLKTVILEENFRSRPEIITWVNQTFTQVFPKQHDLLNDAVPYSPVRAMRDSDDTSGVHVYPLQDATHADEAQHMVRIIQACATRHPTHTIAILVRSRTPLITITTALRQAKIAFHAIDAEILFDRPEIQDLLSLTRALTHLGDRIAWLAILRGPWCGLTLHDLHAITQHAGARVIWSSLLEYHQITALSDDGKKRLQRVVPVIENSLRLQRSLPLVSWIEQTWIDLGGPTLFQDEATLQNTHQFMQLLTEMHDAFAIEDLTQKLMHRYVAADNIMANVQIMTIHKAKGLEFDHVILPHLHRAISSDPHRLLLWCNAVLAPIAASSVASDPLYDYFKMIEKNKADYEAQRLFYVASTRAKESLHLIFSVTSDPKNATGLKKPTKGSFLNILWPTVDWKPLTNY